MKKSILFFMFCLTFMSINAQENYKNLPPLHVDGNHFRDASGNKVVLHGVMDTPSNYFNGGRWQLVNWDYQNSTSATNCLNFFKKLFDGLYNPELGTYCKLFRLHLDPCWTSNSSKKASGFTVKDGKTYDPHGNEVSGEANIYNFDKARLKSHLTDIYIPIAKEALNRGMYVIMRPPGVFPHTVWVGDYYNEYLTTVWDIVSSNATIKKYQGQIMIELGNEPVNLKDANGKDSKQAMHDFFQPIVDKIRSNGFNGIILVPGTGYQSSYENYAEYPITGDNIGYAVHVYSGWYGQSDDNANGNTFIKNFQKQVPIVTTNPIVVTEIDWSPQNKSNVDHYNEFGQPVYKNFGTWATGSTSKWGNAWKAVHDKFGNIGMTLTHPHDFMNIDKWTTKNYNLTYATWKRRTDRVLEPSFLEEMKANGYEDAYEASSGACWVWYKDWAQKDTAAMERYQTYEVPDNPFEFSKTWFCPSIFFQGTATVTSSVIKITSAANGCFGWRFDAPEGIDLSGYKYINMNFTDNLSKNVKNLKIRIYDNSENMNFFGDYCEFDVADSQSISIDIQNLVSKGGKAIDPHHIRMLCFNSKVAQTVRIKSVTLEGTVADGIANIGEANKYPEAIYTTSGAKVNELQRGINIVRKSDGKVVKVYVK